jgi:hypothetical protein
MVLIHEIVHERCLVKPLSGISIQIICIRHDIQLLPYTQTHVKNISELQNNQTTKYETRRISDVWNIHLFVFDSYGLSFYTSDIYNLMTATL